jgi:predicted acylesterase/phospholipase RssA/CRP-like cAMP-binding protein
MDDIRKIEATARKSVMHIESRTAHILAQVRFAVRILLGLTAEEKVATTDTLSDIALNLQRLNILDLEKNIPHWEFLAPVEAEQRAAVLRLLAEKYTFEPNYSAGIRHRLGVTDPEVSAAYERLYRAPISGIDGLHVKKPAAPKASVVGEMVDELMRLEIGAALEWIPFKRGEEIFRQGEAGDSLYVITGGLTHILRESGAQTSTLFALGRGAIVGEMAILTGEPRSASAIAARDSEVCRFTREAFERLSRKYPAVMVQIAVQMVNRLHLASAGRSDQPVPSVITILPISARLKQFASRLAEALSAHGSVMHISRDRIPDLLPAEMAHEIDGQKYDYELTTWIDEQNDKHSVVLLEADAEFTGWTQRCIQRADRILLVADTTQPIRTDLVEQQALIEQIGPLKIMREVVLVHPTRPGAYQRTSEWLFEGVERHHHIALDGKSGFARLARILRGKGIGLVLGGGGMRGSAHAGIIQALRELNIPVDMLGGTSAGAIAAAQLAMGWNPQQILEKTRTKLLTPHILDYTLPMSALTRGQGINEALESMFHDQTIEDLWLPFFCVSANLSSAQLKVHRRGLLWPALRASSSLPGIYPPVTDDDGTLLVDGGVLNNLPVDVMRQQMGAGRVIGVNVSGKTENEAYHYGNSLSGWQVAMQRANPFTASASTPSIVEVISRTSTLSSTSLYQLRSEQADLLLSPPVTRSGLFDFDTFDEMYQIGYEEGLENLSEWLKENTIV